MKSYRQHDIQWKYHKTLQVEKFCSYWWQVLSSSHTIGESYSKLTKSWDKIYTTIHMKPHGMSIFLIMDYFGQHLWTPLNICFLWYNELKITNHAPSFCCLLKSFFLSQFSIDTCCGYFFNLHSIRNSSKLRKAIVTFCVFLTIT